MCGKAYIVYGSLYRHIIFVWTIFLWMMNKHWTFLIIQKKEAVISDKNICQWTKNINLSRKCNVCEEVLENAGCIAIDKNKVVQRVELDMKKIIDVQNKLSNGKDVDQRDISGTIWVVNNFSWGKNHLVGEKNLIKMLGEQNCSWLDFYMFRKDVSRK